MYQQKRLIRTLKSEGYLTFNPYAQHIAYRFRHIAAVDMQTITIRVKGVLDASMGLEATGVDYYVNGGQGRGTKI